MTLLIPLGLLGLLSIIALIVIYVLKPNYQHKEVSSTYIWKLSLKYRKKRLPTSKLRNIFLIICQVLTLFIGAFIMSQPIIRNENGIFDTEVVAVIDASVSMRAAKNGETRFERAVEQVIDLSNRTIDGGGYVSIVLSDGNDSFLVRKAGLAARDEVNQKLRALIDDKYNLGCSYGKTDLNNAVTLCEEVVTSNPTASVYFYTDTVYSYIPEGIEVISVAEDDEWNVAILNAYTVFEEGYYTFFVELGCYGGIAKTVDLQVTINDANAEVDKDTGELKKGQRVDYSANVLLRDNAETTVVFRNQEITVQDYEKDTENIVIVPIGKDSIGQTNKTCVYNFDSVHFYLDEEDSLDADNSFSLYGGRKQPLKIQYATTKRKSFFTGAFGVLRDLYADVWDITVTEVELPREEDKVRTMGYDLYVFEGYTPSQMPQDGVVYLSHPDNMPVGLVKLDEHVYNDPIYFRQEEENLLLKNTDASKIWSRKCTRLLSYDENVYRPLWSMEGNPVLLLQDDEKTKLIVSLYDIEYSNIALRQDFIYFLNNIFECYLAPVVRGYSFEVGENITVNARGNSLTVSNASGSDERVITSLPSAIRLDRPDTYRFSQINWFGSALADTYIFVKIPSSESNISATGITLKAIYREQVDEETYDDLLVYLAAAMLALVFIEWFLQTQDVL